MSLTIVSVAVVLITMKFKDNIRGGILFLSGYLFGVLLSIIFM